MGQWKKAPIVILFVALLCIQMAAAQTYTRSPWDGVSRFTVLLMGLDRRPGGENSLSYRADAIMVASFDPASQRIGVLSIPRDMHFATIETGDLVPVNTLLVRGEFRERDYGPIYMMDTLQYNLGIYIDTYLIFDFEAFVTLIDALGGIEVDVPALIRDDTFPDMAYGYDPLFLTAGRHVFDGNTALKYTRTRHGDNDYLRGERQLQVLAAVRQKLLNPDTLPRLLPRAPALLEALRGHVYTDLTLDEMLQLGQAALNIPDQAIITGSLNQEWSMAYASPSGETVRTPDREKLGTLMAQIFGENYAG